MKKIVGYIIVIAILAAVVIGVFIQSDQSSALKKLFRPKHENLTQRKILYWVAPMDPSYRSNKPGKSPMGMDLVPVYADSGSQDGSIKISPIVEHNLGVKTAIVKREHISRIINTIGYVTVDENNIEHIHSYADGWIRELKVKTTGELVVKGQLLLELYSPTLNNAQDEFLLAIKSKNTSLIKAGEQKLLTLGMAQSQIDELKKTRKMMQRVKLYATRSGIVSKLNVREGMFIKPATDIMTIEDLSHIWMIAEIFERQANWVKEGQPAIATLPFMPGKTWQGKVDYVYPQLDLKTHTLRVRLTFPNPDLSMKPNMYADIKIISQTIRNALTIPRSALIRTGEGDRVILALGKGRYRAQAVKVGIESGQKMAILSGLKAGDSVVTSAQFLIDSESNLKASFDRMTGPISKKKSANALIRKFIGMGTVSAIDLQNRTLTLHHNAIPELGMSAMTMALPVDKNVDLSGIKRGDSIHFVLVKKGHNNYLIITVHVMKTE